MKIIKTIRGLQKLISQQVNIIRRDRLGMIGAAGVVFYIVLAIIAPFIAPYDPMEITYGKDGTVAYLEPPSMEHLLGTTNMGRDVFSQVVMGSRLSLRVGFVSSIFIVFIGVNVGLVSGYLGGWVDNFFMRLVDFTYSLPFLVLMIVLLTLVGGGIWNMTLLMTLVFWRGPARVIRAQVLTVKQQPFIKAAKVAGASSIRIIYRHIFPQTLPLVFLYLAITVGWAVGAEASFSFLGFGDPREMSWGRILNVAFSYPGSLSEWWWVSPPGIAITTYVLSVYLLGHAYEGQSPKMRGRAIE